MRRWITWRERFAPLIAAALRETAGQPEKEIRRALRAVWDDAGCGTRAYWPYDVYLDEIRRQRGLKPPIGRVKGKPAPVEVPAGQLELL